MINSTDFCDQIEEIAKKTGFKPQKLSESLIVITQELPGGRTQTVWISRIGADPHNNTVVRISSPAMKMGAGELLPQRAANDLLRQNAKFLHGGWAIQNVEKDDHLVMFDTQIVETLDPEEFAASVHSVAILADELEKKLGRDRF